MKDESKKSKQALKTRTIKSIRLDVSQVNATVPVNQDQHRGEAQAIVLDRQREISVKADAPTDARKPLLV